MKWKLQKQFISLLRYFSQVRTSYMPNEILWAQRFQHTTVAYDREASKFGITFSTINDMEGDTTPR